MIDAPKRIQLRRTKGWRKPPGAISCARPTRWGNPFWVEPFFPDRFAVWSVVAMALGNPISTHPTRRLATEAAIELFRGAIHSRSSILVPDVDVIVEHLAGHDLACWCALDQPCHVDVLLEVANCPAG